MWKSIKKHLLTGVSYMIPVVVTGGLCMALARVFGGTFVGDATGTWPWMINEIGNAAMTFVVPVLTAFIAFSIADRPGIAPGLALGFISNAIKAGFLGGIFAGLIVGYLILGIRKYIRFPKSLQGLVPIIVIPFFSTLIVGMLMYGILGKPIASLQDWILVALKNLQGGSRFTLGAIIGGMMGFDMGGPINKTAALFCNGLMAEKVYAPAASMIIGGMTPPLGVALSALLFARKKFTPAEHEAAKAAAPLGLCFITEGVLPFAASDPFRVIPACSIGSAVASGLTMMWNVTCTVPHGGIFVVPIMNKPIDFLIALVIGSCVTGLILSILKPAIPEAQEEYIDEETLESIRFDD